MIYTEKVKRAMKIANEAHFEQVDKGGFPYIHHPMHIAEQMNTEDEVIVALLHDVIEDTDMEIQDLLKYDFSEEVYVALNLLTHKREDSYAEYIEKISHNKLARRVKLADLKHNSDQTRLLDKADKYKLSERYSRAMLILELAED